jgi:hypothetical protein
MTAYASANFACPACGALFALTAEVAARKIQCPCGKIFVAPAMPEILPEPEAYHVETPAGEPVASQPAKSTAQMLAARSVMYHHRSVASFSTDDSEPEFSVTRDRVAPIVLLLLGLGMRLIEIPHDRTLAAGNVAASVGILLFQIFLAVVVMLTSVLISSKILSANFGPLGTAILKLAAMAVFAWAVGGMIVVFLQYNIRAFVIALDVMLLIYAVCFAKLFSLDVQEAMLATAICGLMQVAVALAVFGR